MIDLNTEELKLTLSFLEAAYSDLKEEIYKTEDHEYKRRLKEREQALSALMNKLSQAVTAAS